MDNIISSGKVLVLNNTTTIPKGIFKTFKNTLLNTVTLYGIYDMKFNLSFKIDELSIDGTPTTLNDAFDFFVENSANSGGGGGGDLSDYYTKSQTDAEIQDAIASLSLIKFESVDVLPTTGQSNIIYLVPSSTVETNNVKDEFIWVNNAWELIGSTDVNLDNFYTKSEVDTLLTTKISDAPSDGKQYVREDGLWVEPTVDTSPKALKVLSLSNPSSSTVNESIAMGSSNVYSSGSIAVGMANTIMNINSIAVGLANNVNFEQSACFGALNFTNAPNSVAIGWGSRTYSEESLVIGRYNLSTSTETAFVIGNGEDGGSRSDAYVFNKNGTSTQFGIASYNADYSISYTDRSLVDKAYVDSKGSPIKLVGSSIIDTRTNNITTSSTSIILGELAGENIGNVYNSNFFGFIAGNGAANAHNANFFGERAGQNAINGYGSNFFGFNSGREATNATYSNFFGHASGNNATNASYSNFFGNVAGSDATSADFSNFFGSFAGQNATNANNSNFFGYYAGQNATNASYSTLIGYNSGKSFTDNNLGSNNIIIGTNISLSDATINSMNIGGVLFGVDLNSEISSTPSIIPTATGKIGIGVIPTTSTLEVAGDIEVTEIASGIILKSPNGSKFRIVVDDGGALIAQPLV